MITKKQILIFKKSADSIYKTKDYTSATILYFKTLFAIQDLMLLRKIGYEPKSHTERFRILKKEIPESYQTLD